MSWIIELFYCNKFVKYNIQKRIQNPVKIENEAFLEYSFLNH